MIRRVQLRRCFAALAVVVLATGFSQVASTAPFSTPTAPPPHILQSDISFLRDSRLGVEQRLDRLGYVQLQLRSKAVRALGPGEQSELWRAHERRWLDSGVLSKAEQAIVQKFYDLSTPEWYARTTIDPNGTELCKQAASVFRSRELKDAVLYYVGQKPGEPLWWTPRPVGMFVRVERQSVIALKRFTDSIFPSLHAVKFAPMDFLCSCGAAHCGCPSNCTCVDAACTPTTDCGCGGGLGYCGLQCALCA